MGSCCSKSSSDGGSAVAQQQVSVKSRDLGKRERQWQTTGQVVLRDAGLKILPTAVFNVGNAAKVLDVKGNKLTELPIGINQLSQLHRVVLSGNQLTTLQGISALQNLKTLLLEHNKLIRLPAEIGRLEKLECLVCSHNLLTELPEDLGSLTALKYFKCDHNQIDELPAQLAACTLLVELDASHNDLKRIPAQFEALQGLACLALETNMIRTIPSDVLRSCTSLHTIKLENNPITMEVFQEIEGYAAYEQRRRSKVDKQLAGGAAKNLSEGIERNVA